MYPMTPTWSSGILNEEDASAGDSTLEISVSETADGFSLV
jgi:hypothetical protein